MRIVGEYSFNRGKEAVTQRHPGLLKEIRTAVANVNANEHKSKTSKEKTMPGRMLFNPKSLNKAFKAEFAKLEWGSVRVACEYSTEHYVPGYAPKTARRGAFREMDFIKGKLGVEVQFGKYAFMVYNVCAKMTIFRNMKCIETGVEIVPVKAFADEMSTGVSYFEQFIWDLEKRGIANIDVPVLILGVDA